MNPKYHLLVAIAALSLGACSTDDTCTEPEPVPVPENEGYKISFTVAEDTETRTTLTTGDFLRWESTDKVGIYTNGNNINSNIETTADVSKSPVEFVGTLRQTVSPGDMFYAYYPYAYSRTHNPVWGTTNPLGVVQLSIPAVQQQAKADVYNGESHPLVALPMEFQWEQGSDACRINSVRFRQLGSIVELQLYSSNEALRSESIRSVTFESDTPLAGDFTFDLKTVTDKDELTISGYTSKMVTTLLEEPATIPATSGEAARVYLTIAPGQYAGQIVVKTDAAQYTFRLKNTMAFERAMIKGLPADLAKAKREIFSDDFILFEDSEVKRICVENWDTNKDGELSYKEAAAVTSIETKFRITSIRNFNELRYFTGLKLIEETAFEGCTGLTNITIPDGVTSIGEYAFYKCSSLTSITIPDGVTSIGREAFYKCSSLTSITIPDGVTTIVYGFQGCTGLKSVQLPDGLQAIGGKAFRDCSKLTSINIPDGVQRIGSSAFYGCTGLTSINIPETVTAIEEYAFQGCTSLTSITIPDGVTSIGEYAFSNCSGLTSINIPNGVTTIGGYAFADCSSLTSINIPDGVTTIETGAFQDCSSLTSINIPDGVTEIGWYAFYGCSSLTSIHLPDGLTTIGISAFNGCSSLTSITIPDRVTTIEEKAFYDCCNLTSINILSKTLSPFGTRAFAGCSSLSVFEGEYASADHRCLILDGALLAFAPADRTEYTIPDGVTKIGIYVFNGCSNLTSVTIPNEVTWIGERAFYGCSSLTSVYCKPTTPPTSGYNVFVDTSPSLKIYVPTASVEAYKTANVWSGWAFLIVADNN